MEAQYSEIARIEIAHSYYANGRSNDFDYIFSDATRRLLDHGRLVARTQQGQLIFYANQASVGLLDTSLTVGLVLKNPNFFNYTETTADQGLQQFTNSPNKRALKRSLVRSIVDQRFTHSVSSAARPLFLTVLTDGKPIANAAGQAIDFELENDEVSEVNFLLPESNMGHFQLTEQSASGRVNHRYFSSKMLSQKRVEALINIKLDTLFLIDPPTFSVNFTTKQETLSYYVIAQNYSSEFNKLSVSGLDKRIEGTSTPIKFSKITASNFTNNHYTKDELAVSDNSKVVLFESDTKISRSEKPKMNMQLDIDGETLIASLPMVGPERLTADLFVYLSKPKT